MERIGIAASKIAKGNLLTYNISVVVISFLCSLFLFFICGVSIVAALFFLSLIFRWLIPTEFTPHWASLIKICLIGLSVVVGCFNLFAIFKNFKVSKQKI